MIQVAVIGATGRMGEAVLRLLAAEPAMKLVGACGSPTSPHVGRDAGEVARLPALGVALSADISSALLGADVCIDFSTRTAFPMVAHAMRKARVAWVCGTTGLGESELRSLDHQATLAPVLWSPNMSLGVHVLVQLVELAARQLGPSFDVEITELHHRNKADAPSGTARRLAEAALEGRGRQATVVTGREGMPGKRPQDEIGMFALRGGDVIGDHSVHLLGLGERLELSHRATSRDLFARGALRAAGFLVGRAPRRYSMSDLLRVHDVS